MKTYFNRILFLFFTFSFILSCSKDDNETEPVNQEGGIIFRSQIVTINLDNIILSENEYQGTFGNQNIVLKKADDNRLVFSVAFSTPIGFMDLVVPSLNNATFHYEVKNTALIDTPDVTMIPFFTNLNAIELDDSAQNIALQNSINSFNAVFTNLSIEDKTEMAIIYKANKNLINSILLNNFSSFGKYSTSSTSLTASVLSHKTAVLGIAAGAVLFELGVHPGVKALGAVVAGVSTGFAIEYFGQVIETAAIRYGIIVDDIVGINNKNSLSTYISFQDDVQKTISLETKNRKLIASDSSNAQADIVSFFKYHNQFNFIITAINSQITWINNNVVFANFSLIELEVMPVTTSSSNINVDSVDFNKINFSINHPNLQLVSSTLQSNGQIDIKIKIIGTSSSLPIDSDLNYSYSDEFNSFTGKLPIKVSVEAPQEITIGSQTWMLKNLDVSNYRNGDPIPQVQDIAQWEALTTGAWCYYENSTSYGSVYGKLYNMHAVNDPRGLAPDGWHIPSDNEWTILVNYLGGVSVAGDKMKEVGTTHWLTTNSGVTNSSGFTAIGGGFRSIGFTSIKEFTSMWSTTPNYLNGINGAWSMQMDDSKCRGSVIGDEDDTATTYGFSVRCVKN